jgi:hypothetical protein
MTPHRYSDVDVDDGSSGWTIAWMPAATAAEEPPAPLLLLLLLLLLLPPLPNPEPELYAPLVLVAFVLDTPPAFALARALFPFLPFALPLTSPPAEADADPSVDGSDCCCSEPRPTLAPLYP